MKLNIRQAIKGPMVVLAFIGIFYGLLGRTASFLEVPRLKAQDLLFVARDFFVKKTPNPGNLFVITIDDLTIEKINEKWPFRRRLYADLIYKIGEANPKVIGFDLFFSGKSDPLDDALLADAIRASGKIVLASYQNYVTSISEFAMLAAGSGAVDKLADRDQSVRRTKLYYSSVLGKPVAWSWELELFFQIMGLKRNLCQVSENKISCSLPSGAKIKIPFFDGSDFKINYRYRLEDIPHLSLAEVLKTEDLAPKLAGKIVLIGSTSKQLHDEFRTPLGVMSGTIINANTLLNLLDSDYLKKVPFWTDWLVVMIAALIGFSLGLRRNVFRGLGWLVAVSVLFASEFYALFLLNRVSDCLTPFIVSWAVFLGAALMRYFRTTLENVQLQNKASTDPLTGLSNRRVLEARADEEFEKLVRAKIQRKTDIESDLCLMMVDIDDFKKINDRYGHPFGDEALKNVSFSLRSTTRKNDLIARFGGEEFCLLLPNTRKEEALQIAEKIRGSIADQKYNYVNRMVSFTVSIGVAASKKDGLVAFKALLNAADQALYEAKKTGKNRVVAYKSPR